MDEIESLKKQVTDLQKRYDRLHRVATSTVESDRANPIVRDLSEVLYDLSDRSKQLKVDLFS